MRAKVGGGRAKYNANAVYIDIKRKCIYVD